MAIPRQEMEQFKDPNIIPIGFRHDDNSNLFFPDGYSPEVSQKPSQELIIDSPINEGTVLQVARFVKKIEENSASNAELFIHSFGGDVHATLAIYDLLLIMRNQGITLTTIGLGTIQSAGVLLLQAGERRLLSEHSSLFIHPVQPSQRKNINLVEIEELIRLDEIYDVILAERSELSPEEIKTMRNNGHYGTYIPAKHAIAVRLADGNFI